MSDSLIGRYKIDHPLFADITFAKEEDVRNTAERLCEFLIKHTDRTEAHVDVLKYDTEEDSGGETQTIWWYHTSYRAELTVRETNS